MNKNELKQLCIKTIDENRDEIIRIGNEIYKNPELGYKEFKSTEIVKNAMKNLDGRLETEIAYTGCKIVANEEKSGPRVAIIGELDSVVCADHKDANELGNIHACGHNVQIANMIGAAFGILKSGVFKHLDGSMEFIAIPAEECVDYEYRANLQKENKIKYIGGKQEYLYRNGFDNTDIILQCHMIGLEEGKECIINTDTNGFMSKMVTFYGKSSHAGFAPHEGVNALNMAQLAMNNIHAQRETFKDEDKVRVSMVISNGGDLVNVVPSKVTMEIMVRAFSIDAMTDANKKVNRALQAAALALGGNVEIKDSIGYLPMKTDRNLGDIYKQNMIEYASLTEDNFIMDYQTAGSTDLGDISQIMPCLHVWSNGITGGLHTEEYNMEDEEKAYILPAKMLALSLIDLLYDDAKEAKDIINKFNPFFTKEQYLNFLDDYVATHNFNYME